MRCSLGSLALAVASCSAHLRGESDVSAAVVFRWGEPGALGRAAGALRSGAAVALEWEVPGGAGTVVRGSADWTAKTLDPMLEAQMLEGSPVVKPACYKAQPGEDCWEGCPWVQQGAQACLGLLPGGVAVSDFDRFWPVNRILPHDYLPLTNNTCAAPTPACTLDTLTVTEARYDDASGYASAFEIATKLNGRDRLFAAAGVDVPAGEDVANRNACADYNRLAADWAVQHAPADVAARFHARGAPFEFANDTVTAIYPVWSPSHLSIAVGPSPSGRAGNVTLVSSTAFILSDKVPILGGNHYCKFLSPFRALELVYEQAGPPTSDEDATRSASVAMYA